MKFATLVVCLIGLAVASSFNSEYDSHWRTFKETFNKNYKVKEEIYRRTQFERNIVRINSHNLEKDLGLHSFGLGLNEYADMSGEEFVRTLNGYRGDKKVVSENVFQATDDLQLPATVDWRTKGYVTPIKNQGQCGSCWAFSTTGSVEGQHFKKTGKLVSLSEQNLVDCAGPEGPDGCDGGWMDDAFKYIQVNNGIDTEESYPYTAQDGTCQFKKLNVGATISGHIDIPKSDEKALQEAVATVGPISVAIDASHSSFQLYSQGIYNEPACDPTLQDHGVLVVGYGTEDGKDYWLVKNSWGTSWGMKGYIKMSRNKNNQCGIVTNASYPLV